MATQTGSFDFKTAKNAKESAEATASADATAKANEAKKVATNFLAVDASGIMVYDGVNGTQTPTSPSASTRNVFIDSDSVDVRQGTTVLATFGETSRIGKQNATHTDISSNGMQIYASNGSTLIAQLGYGEGTSADGTQVTQPFYTFGTRGGTVGNYSVTSGTKVVANNVEYPIIASGYASHAEGAGTTASGHSSHAEGERTTASGSQSHAEGDCTTASGAMSHAEGLGTTSSGLQSHAEGTNTTASGSSSHAEGRSTIASGGYSHAANYGTKAEYDYQTAIGFYNDNSSRNLFEIGNGDLNTGSRSNAFEVDWFGNVTIPSGAKYMVGTSGISDFVVEQGTSGIWTYRKWNSGIAECWGTSNQTNVAATTKWPNASMYYGILTNVSFPSGLFTSTPTSCHLFGRITGGNGWLTQNTNMSSSTVGQVYVITPASITLTNVNINIYATGRWK